MWLTSRCPDQHEGIRLHEGWDYQSTKVYLGGVGVVQGRDIPPQTVLLDIYERLGSIDARLDSGSRRHDEFSEELKEIKDKIEPIPLLGQALERMTPIVDDYAKSRNKMAGVLLAFTTLAGGIGFFAAEIKTFFMGKH